MSCFDKAIEAIRDGAESIVFPYNCIAMAVGADGARVIAEELKANHTLTAIKMYDTGIGDEGASAFAAMLETNTTLRSITLCRECISDEGAKAIARALETNLTLGSINLSDNRIGDAGVKALAKALENNTTLASIDLSWNRTIGDEGVKVIAKTLETNTTLTSIDLRGGRIGHEGAGAIAKALETNTTVTSIDLSDNHISTRLLQTINARLYRNQYYARIAAEFPIRDRQAVLALLHSAVNENPVLVTSFHALGLVDKLVQDRRALNPSLIATKIDFSKKDFSKERNAWLVQSLQFLLECFLSTHQGKNSVAKIRSQFQSALSVFAQIDRSSPEYLKASFLFGEHLLKASSEVPSDERAFQQSAVRFFDICRRAPDFSDDTSVDSSDLDGQLFMLGQALAPDTLTSDSSLFDIRKCSDATIEAALKNPEKGMFTPPREQTKFDVEHVMKLVRSAEKNLRTIVTNALNELATSSDVYQSSWRRCAKQEAPSFAKRYSGFVDSPNLKTNVIAVLNNLLYPKGIRALFYFREDADIAREVLKKLKPEGLSNEEIQASLIQGLALLEERHGRTIPNHSCARRLLYSLDLVSKATPQIQAPVAPSTSMNCGATS